MYIDTVLSVHCILQTSTSSCHFVVGNSPPVSESFWMSRVASLACGAYSSILLPKFEFFMLLHSLFLFRRTHTLQKLDLGFKGTNGNPVQHLSCKAISKHYMVLEHHTAG